MVVTPPSSLLQPSVIITDSYSGVDFDADVYVDLDANFEVVVDVNVDVNADVDVGGLPSPNLSHRSPLPAHLLHDQLPLPILILVLILMMMLMLTLMLTLKLSLTSM